MSISSVEVLGKFENPKFIKPVQIRFEIEKHPVVWEAIENYDSVYILIYNKDTDKFIFVKQFRAVVYTSVYFKKYGRTKGILNSEKVPYDEGYTLELCAGLCDKPNLSHYQCAAEEVLEETGYSVNSEDLILVTHFLSPARVGVDYLFFVEVNNGQNVSSGGGLIDEGESIKVEEVPATEFAQSVVDDTTSSVTSNIVLKFACLWYLQKFNQN